MKEKEGKDDVKVVVLATQPLLNTTSFSRSLRLSIPALPELTIPRFNGFITTSPYKLCDIQEHTSIGAPELLFKQQETEPFKFKLSTTDMESYTLRNRNNCTAFIIDILAGS